MMNGWQEGQHPSEGGTGLIAVCIAFSVIEILFVGARFYTRYMQNARYTADDYVMLVALVCTILPSYHRPVISVYTKCFQL